MKLHPFTCLALLAGVSLCNCGWLKRESRPVVEETEKPAKKAELIGRISSISPDGAFVLIQRYQSFTAAIGSVLTTRGENDRSANLLFTGESLGSYAAADLQSGMPHVGDAVFLPAPVEAPTEP